MEVGIDNFGGGRQRRSDHEKANPDSRSEFLINILNENQLCQKAIKVSGYQLFRSQLDFKDLQLTQKNDATLNAQDYLFVRYRMKN